MMTQAAEQDISEALHEPERDSTEGGNIVLIASAPTVPIVVDSPAGHTEGQDGPSILTTPQSEISPASASHETDASSAATSAASSGDATPAQPTASVYPPPPPPGGPPSPATSPQSTFTGIITPLMGLFTRYLRSTIVRGFGHDMARSLEDAFISAFFLIDNFNPIAWGKAATWSLHPGRFTGNRRMQNIHFAVFIRVLWLITNLLTVFVQYSGLLFTPMTKFRSTLMLSVMGDAITDGVKYAGFTNHILQTLFLYRPQERFGKSLVNTSRHYMEDIQLSASLAAFALIFVVEGRRATTLYSLYALFMWADFILKRIRPPQNYIRTKISSLANEVQNNTYRTNATAGAIVGPPAAATGFVFREKDPGHKTLYAIFFFGNLVFKAVLYTPVVNWLVTKMPVL